MRKTQKTLLTLLWLLSGAAFAQVPFSAYVVNALGENLSMINLETHSVNPNAAALGLYPNQVAIRGEKAYLVISGLNEIRALDLATFATLQTFDTGAGSNPWEIEFINDELAAVSLLFTNQVIFLNLQSGQAVQTVTVGNGPEGLLYSDGYLYVANSGFNGSGFDPGTVSVIDVSDYSQNTISVGINPQSLDKDSQGNIVAACSGDYVSVGGQMDVIDPLSLQVIHSVPAGAVITAVAVSPEDRAYLATSGFGVLVYNLAGQFFERDVANPLPGGPGMAFDRQGRAYIVDFAADSVYVYSPAHQRLNGYLVGNGPLSIDLYDPAPNAIGQPGDPVIGSFILRQNYPNPFNPATAISYQLSPMGQAAISQVDLLIYNLRGQKVRTLVQTQQPAGRYEVKWDGRDDGGRPVPSGVYFYRLRAGGQAETRRMQLIR